MLRAELPDLDEEEAEERDLWPREDDRIWEISGVLVGFIWLQRCKMMKILI
jgi:hypothetical protein